MEGFARPFPPSFANGPAGIGTATSLGHEPGDLPLDIPLGIADQACKECRRRKAKCNRAIPTCNLCVKYRRHCLYEKHSRTPLTRKSVPPLTYPIPRLAAVLRKLVLTSKQTSHRGRRETRESGSPCKAIALSSPATPSGNQFCSTDAAERRALRLHAARPLLPAFERGASV